MWHDSSGVQFNDYSAFRLRGFYHRYLRNEIISRCDNVRTDFRGGEQSSGGNNRRSGDSRGDNKRRDVCDKHGGDYFQDCRSVRSAAGNRNASL